MSIILNKDIYDPSQGKALKPIMDELDDLATKTKETMSKMEKSLMDVSKTGGGSELKELTIGTEQLTKETNKLIAVEKTKTQIIDSLKLVTDKYNTSIKSASTAQTNANQGYVKTLENISKLKLNIDGLIERYSALKKGAYEDGKAAIASYENEIEDLSIKIDVQNKRLKEATNLAKNYEIAVSTEGETIESLKAQLAVTTIAWNKLTAAQIENSEEGKELQIQMKNISETLRVLEMERGQSGRNVGKYAQSLKGLKLELRELKGVLMNSAEGSDEYNRALQRSAYLTDELGDMQARVKGTAMDFEGVMGNVVKVSTGIAGAFEVAQGAAALFGVENEDLQKTMLKVQAAIAITNGLQGLDGMGKAFKNLLTQIRIFAQGVNKALSATIIGAFLAAIVAVVAYWDDIKEAITGVGNEQKKLLEDSQKMAEAEREKLNAIEESEAILKLQGKTERQILETKITAAGVAIEAAKDEFEMQQKIALRQVEAEKRNLQILQKFMEPVIFVLKAIDLAVAKLGKLMGRKWDLGLGEMMTDFTKWTNSFIFDPEDAREKGAKTVKEAEDKLKELQNKWAGYQLNLKELDRKANEDYSKSLYDKLALQKKISEETGSILAENAKSTYEKQKELTEKRIEDEKKAAESFEEIGNKLAEDALKRAEKLKDARDKEIEDEIEKRVALAEMIHQTAIQAGTEIGQLIAKGELSMKSFFKVILKMTIDAIEKQILAQRAVILANEIARKSWAGVPSFILLSALIAAAFETAKAAVASFAVGTEYLTGKKEGKTGGILIEAHEGERILTSKQNDKLLGISNDDIPGLVHAGLNSMRTEKILKEVSRYTSETAQYLSNGETGWEDKNFTFKKNWKTGKVTMHPKK